jgi:hypothetical protein
MLHVFSTNWVKFVARANDDSYLGMEGVLDLSHLSDMLVLNYWVWTGPLTFLQKFKQMDQEFARPISIT